MDVASTGAIGANAGSPSATTTLIVDEDISTTGEGRQLHTLGRITTTGGTSNIWHNAFQPDGTTINSGNTHSYVSTINVYEPDITLTSGTVTNASTLRIASSPTEGTNNYGLWVDGGASRFDGTVSVDGREIYKAEDLRVGLFTSTDNF